MYNNKSGYTFGGLAVPAFFLTLLLCTVAIESRPSTDNEAQTETETDIAVFPPNADNVELHHVKLVDGVLHEDHPIVMYKEDFVSENYEPKGNETKVNPKHKKYRHLQRFRHQHSRSAAKLIDNQQEKILFDVLPETPILSSDDDDSGADNFEAAELVEPAKDETPQKYPKKYHSRQRRQAYHSYNSVNSNPYIVKNKAQSRIYLPVLPANQHEFQRYPVAGKKPIYKGKLPNWRTQSQPGEPTAVITRLDTDDENSLFHNSDPGAANFSVFDRPRPGSNQASGPSSTTGLESWQMPADDDEPRPIWAPSIGRRPIAGRQPATQAPPLPPPRRQQQTTSRPLRPQPVTRAPVKVSTCVWAIVNCCSPGSTKIRYNCFEEFGCHGAFWGVNPCADSVRDGSLALASASKVLPQPGQSAAAWGTPLQSPLQPQPTRPDEALLYPAELSHEAGSACHRASKLCCKLPSLDSLYACFLHQQCDQKLSDILATCA